MGYHISTLDNTELVGYIGSTTMYACADAGVFDAPVSADLQEKCRINESIMAIVDKEGVQHALSILQTIPIQGRDVEKFISSLQNEFKNGFIIYS